MAASRCLSAAQTGARYKACHAIRQAGDEHWPDVADTPGAAAEDLCVHETLPGLADF